MGLYFWGAVIFASFQSTARCRGGYPRGGVSNVAMGGRRTPRPTRRPVAVALALLLLVSFASLVQPVEGKMTAIKRTSSGGPLRRSTRNVGGQPRAPDGDGPAVSKRTYRGSFQLDGVPWQRHRDPKSGEEYYFNVATKTSAWDDPRRGARETEETRRGNPSGAGPSGAGPSDAGPSGDTPRVVKPPGDAPRVVKPPRDPKSAADRRDPAEKWYGSGDHASRRPTDAREAFQRKAEARERVRAAKRLERAARKAAGAPPAPTRHGPFFASGVVAVAVLSVVSSVVAWLVRSVRSVHARRGPGGTQAAAGGDGTDPLAVELRALAAAQLAKWFARTEERLRRRAREFNALVADVASSRSFPDALAKISCAIANAERAPELAAVGRFLIATYYFNLCADKYGEYAWRRRYWEYAERYGLTNNLSDGLSDKFSGVAAVTPSGFPWIAAFVVTCTTMMCRGVHPVRCSLFMLAYDVMDTVGLLFDVFATRREALNELAMKKIAMFGCTCLLVAHFAKGDGRGGAKRGDGSDANDPFAGLAMDDPFDDGGATGDPFDGWRRRDAFGARKSAALLAARCAMAALFFFVGFAQIRRIVARDFALFAPSSDAGGRTLEAGAYRDGHDNNWLLLEFALATPLAIGWGGHVVTRALTLTLFAEAFGCWRFWAPRTFRPDHARAHFVTNLACGGGLILLRVFGAGRYTVDDYVRRNKKKT